VRLYSGRNSCPNNNLFDVFITKNWTYRSHSTFRDPAAEVYDYNVEFGAGVCCSGLYCLMSAIELGVDERLLCKF